MEMMRRAYSIVNRPVSAHSRATSSGPYAARTSATLSSETSTTLKMIAHSSTTSKARPAGVSASKMMV
jgi:hypothetical protein